VTALARPRSNCTVNYRHILSSERALQNNKPALSNGNFKKKEKLVAGPRWVPATKIDWPTDDSQSVTSTSTSFHSNAAPPTPIKLKFLINPEHKPHPYQKD
jgi:hypothetical protein